jgi:hypothetical protein
MSVVPPMIPPQGIQIPQGQAPNPFGMGFNSNGSFLCDRADDRFVQGPG